MSASAFELLGLRPPASGPRGGDLNNPKSQPECRRSPLNAAILPETGLPSLHRFDTSEEWKDTAIVGHQKELPWHRMAAWMLINRCDVVQIAQAAGVTPQAVRQLKAERWFQELLATLENSRGEAVTGVIESEALASVQKLVSLRDGAESDRVQLAAALALIEHSRGKPKQFIESTVTTRKQTPAEELAEIENELRSIRENTSLAVPAVVTPIPET